MASLKNKKTLQLVEVALLVAIEILMSFTPVGYLRVGIVEITFMTIPVAIAAVMVGPGASLILGTVFGISSFVQCFGISPFGTALAAVNPFFTALVCLLPRMLTGLFAGLIFRALSKKNPKSFPAVLLTSLSAPVCNTLLFVSLLFLCFHSASISIGGNTLDFSLLNLFDTFAVIAGINGLVEAGVCTLLGTAVGKALLHFKKD